MAQLTSDIIFLIKRD